MTDRKLSASIRLKFARLRIGSLAWAYAGDDYESLSHIPVFTKIPTTHIATYSKIKNGTPMTIVDVNVDNRGEIMFCVLVKIKGTMEHGWVIARSALAEERP